MRSAAIYRLDPQLRLRRRASHLIRFDQQSHSGIHKGGRVGRPYRVRERELIEVVIGDRFLLRRQKLIQLAALASFQVGNLPNIERALRWYRDVCEVAAIRRIKVSGHIVASQTLRLAGGKVENSYTMQN